VHQLDQIIFKFFVRFQSRVFIEVRPRLFHRLVNDGIYFCQIIVVSDPPGIRPLACLLLQFFGIDDFLGGLNRGSLLRRVMLRGSSIRRFEELFAGFVDIYFI
jgi:hypothetical protein